MLSVILTQGCTLGDVSLAVQSLCGFCLLCFAAPPALSAPQAVFALAVPQVQEGKPQMFALPLKRTLSAAFLVTTLKKSHNSPSCADGQSSHTYGQISMIS